MGESVPVSWQEVPANFKENIKETAEKVVKAIEKLFKGLSVGNVNDELNTYIKTYFRLEEILGVSKGSLIYCLDDKLKSEWLRGNFTFCEWLVLDEWCKVYPSWKYLEWLFKWYFSLVEEMNWIEKIEDLDDYNNQLSKILEFSKSPVMENNIWEEGDESCGAHLRNLLSPFMTLVDFFEDSSRRGENFKNAKNELIPFWKENKRMIDDFCKFLNDKNLFISDF